MDRLGREGVVCVNRAIIERDLKAAFDDGYRAGVEAATPKWISVEERLPKKNQRVVVTDGKHAWDYGQFNGLAFCFEKDNPNPRKWNWKNHTVRHVEWWMPKETALPEPPKEG